MSELVWAFAVVAVALLVWGARQEDGIYQFPFLAGVAWAGWVLPQAIGLARGAHALPDGALERLLVMGILSAGMCLAGYAAAPGRWRGFRWRFDSRRLEIGAWVLLGVGFVFWAALYSLPAAELERTQWTGRTVALLFFARLTNYAFILGLLLFLHRKRRSTLVLTGLAAVPMVLRIILLGRRSVTAELVLGLLIAIWLVRDRAVPRKVFVPLAVVGMVMAGFSAGDYRSRAMDAEGLRLEEIAAIPWWDNVLETLNHGGPEIRNALYTMDLAARESAYDLGLSHWDFMVFSYVPAQVVGEAVKQSLYLNAGLGFGSHDDRMAEWYGYQRTGGSTATGLKDAFLSFGYAGALKFALIGFLMAQLYGAARRGDLSAQILYLLLVVPSMHAVTHSTFWFFKDWPHMAAFLLPVLVAARQPASGTVRHGHPVDAGTVR